MYTFIPMNITFKQQADKFLQEGAIRKRNPLRPATIRTYKSQLESVIIPEIGKLKLQTVGNKVVSELVQKMAEQGYSARTIMLNVTIIKKVRKSAISDNGDVLYPYSWSPEVLDAPAVSAVTSDLTIHAEAIESLLERSSSHDKALYVVLSGTGLRIAEARAIQVVEDDGVSTIWSPKESKIVVRQQMTRQGLGPTKTSAGIREVDLSPELNEFLIKQADTFNGFMFPGKESSYAARLNKNQVNSGFHSFRRFRITHLESQSVPRGLAMFWTGHQAKDIHESYIRFGQEIESRKQWAIKAGLGFKLPEVL